MKVGLVGTGNMGNPMARNLMKAGHQLVVNDLRKEVAQNLVDQGATWVDTPRDIAGQVDVIFTSLPLPRNVEQVALGEEGILAGAHTGMIYADLSTNSPTMIRRISARFAEKGIVCVDAPVSGGVYGAEAGTLAVMVGGDEDAYQRIKPALDAIGTHVVYCGAIGNGMVTKICNNLVSMGTGQILGEALTLGVKAGVDLGVLADAIANSSGSNRRLTEKFSRFLFKGNFTPGFATALAAKDVGLFTELAREYDLPVASADLVGKAHQEAMTRGWGAEDSDAVVRIQEERAGIQLRLV